MTKPSLQQGTHEPAWNGGVASETTDSQSTLPFFALTCWALVLEFAFLFPPCSKAVYSSHVWASTLRLCLPRLIAFRYSTACKYHSCTLLSVRAKLCLIYCSTGHSACSVALHRHSPWILAANYPSHHTLSSAYVGKNWVIPARTQYLGS